MNTPPFSFERRGYVVRNKTEPTLFWGVVDTQRGVDIRGWTTLDKATVYEKLNHPEEAGERDMPVTTGWNVLREEGEVLKCVDSIERSVR